MEVVTGRARCTQVLSDLATDPETSYGLVFITGGHLTADDVIALREAARLCDVAVAAVIGKSLPDAYHAIMQEAGTDMIYTHQPQPQEGFACQLVQKGGGDITPYLETILLVMPSVVAVHLENLATRKAVKSIEKTFYQLFTLVEVNTPKNILSRRQQELIEVLMLAQDMVDHGERRVEPLLQQTLAALDKHNFSGVQQLAVYNVTSFQEVKTTIPHECFLFAEVKEGDHLWRRTVKLRA